MSLTGDQHARRWEDLAPFPPDLVSLSRLAVAGAPRQRWNSRNDSMMVTPSFWSTRHKTDEMSALTTPGAGGSTIRPMGEFSLSSPCVTISLYLDSSVTHLNV
jgi:hypothetical protein